MPVDDTLENIPMLLTVVAPVSILGILFVLMLFKKKDKKNIPALMLFPFIGMLIGNFTYHNVSDLLLKKDYARFKEGSIFGYIGLLIGGIIGFILKRKGLEFTGNMGMVSV